VATAEHKGFVTDEGRKKEKEQLGKECGDNAKDDGSKT